MSEFSRAVAYDELDRGISTTDSLGNHSQYRYDSNGKLVLFVDVLGNSTKLDFDIYGRLITETNEQTDNGLGKGNNLEPIQNKFEYDLNDNLICMCDALGRKTIQKYDSLDRRVEIIYADETTTKFLYDMDGNIEKTIDNNYRHGPKGTSNKFDQNIRCIIHSFINYDDDIGNTNLR